jgi:uncharacterized protein (DUF433 family)
VATPTRNPGTLIERYVEPDPYRPGPGDVRLIGSGIHVWALIGHYQATGRDPQYVADSYYLPLDAVLAALAYYQRHQEAIEARLAANVA